MAFFCKPRDVRIIYCPDWVQVNAEGQEVKFGGIIGQHEIDLADFQLPPEIVATIMATIAFAEQPTMDRLARDHEGDPHREDRWTV